MTASRRDGLTAYPTNRVILLENCNCPYCNGAFSDTLTWTKEHVIGRKFVPKGSLNAAFNLLLRACARCNGIKADLENDISVITMHPDTLGRFPVDDARLRDEVARKAQKAFSRRTGKPVAAGEPPFVIRGKMGDALEMTFTMRSPPQVDENRQFLLARLQLQGFFFFLTYKEDIQRGHFWLGDFHPLLAVRREDWGNPQLAWFENETKGWLPRLNAITADGFYKVWIRRKDEVSNAWAWAIEWNQNFRLAGFFGMDDAVQPHVAAMPPLKLDTLHGTGKDWLKVRTEVPLAPERDTLFDWDEAEEAA